MREAYGTGYTLFFKENILTVVIDVTGKYIQLDRMRITNATFFLFPSHEQGKSRQPEVEGCKPEINR